MRSDDEILELCQAIEWPPRCDCGGLDPHSFSCDLVQREPAYLAAISLIADAVPALLVRAQQAEAAIQRVRDLHEPDLSMWKPEAWAGIRNRAACKGCRAPGIGGFSWGQCPTIRALDGVTRGDD